MMINGKLIVDERCTCGRKKSEHSPNTQLVKGGVFVEPGHGDGVGCERFTFKRFILKDGTEV
jgi:hypothetical protein